MTKWYDEVSSLKGVGEKKKKRLQEMGIRNVGALLEHFPYRYKDRRNIISAADAEENRTSLVSGKLIRVNSRTLSGRRSLTECTFRDDSCTFSAVFFNMPYLKKSLMTGADYTVFGEMKYRNRVRVWTNPEMVLTGTEKDRRGIIPVYRCTSGITTNDFNKWISFALSSGAADDEWIDQSVLDENRICGRGYAYRNIHFPESPHAYKTARYRLVYEQLLLYQLALRFNRKNIEDEAGDASITDADITPFTDELPFSLTEGQKKCITDIEQDLVARRPMNRLVQGDVGCGKTLVAEVAIYKCVKSGHQAAMMAPTEILARQHYAKLCEDYKMHGISVGLLTSGMKVTERRELLDSLKSGELDVIVGTHAIIQEDVEFNDLALVITDEQHRFGVNQRKSLVRKGRAVNVCVMSATPIPRTLAATVFGDMDFSIIRDKPAERLGIITRALDTSSRERAYIAALEELEAGHQVYVVAPSIDCEDDSMNSAEQLYEEIRERFGRYNVVLLHGRLGKSEKEMIMKDFAEGRIDVLVATVVIEVGIDVANASIMIIENSERFGLAQMHQLRGRVGRSNIQSYCYLINYSRSESSAARAKALVELSDGFEISEADYQLRGPGDISGTMQSGNFGSKIIQLCSYSEILDIAVRDAEKISNEPGLADLEHVKNYIKEYSSGDNRDII